MEKPHFQLDPELLLHNGQPFDSSLQLIAPPPSDIGQVISVGSNIRLDESRVQKSGQTQTVIVWLMLTVLPYAACASAFLGLSGPPLLISMAAVGCVAVWACHRLSRVHPSVSYLGAEGLSVSQLTHGTVQTKSLRFGDAAHFFFRETLVLLNDQQAGVGFSCEWLDASSRTLFSEGGALYTTGAIPGTEHLHALITAAEGLWTEGKVRDLEVLAGQGEPLVFSLQQIGTIKLEENAIDFDIKGTRARWMTSDMEPAEIRNGFITFRRYDAGTISSRGRTRFLLSRISDQACFLKFLPSYARLPIRKVF